MNNHVKPRHVLLSFIRLAFRTYKPYFFSLMGLCLVNSALTVFGAYSISAVISFLEKGDYKTAIYAGLVISGIDVLLFFLSKLTQRFNDVCQVRMSEEINHIMAEKIISLPFSCLEDPYYIELKKNAQMAINNMGAIYDLMSSGVTIVSSVISLIGLGTIIITFEPLLLVVLAVGIILNVAVVLISLKFQMKFFNELLPINYKFGYYLDALVSTRNAKDYRLYKDIHGFMYTKFKSFGNSLNKYLIKIQMKSCLFNCLGSFFQYLEMGFVYVMVGVKTITEGLTIAQFSLTAASAISFSQCISAIIASSSMLIRSSQYIAPLMELLAVKEDKDEGQEDIKDIQSIAFDHVTFKYPNTDAIILNDVSFTINANQKISIVGLNGAGKTTIVKLLCRLYHVNSGRILVNGKQIEEYRYGPYIATISAVFQDYKLFNYSLRENIRPGISEREAEKIGKDVGIDEKIQTLPNKYDSNLGKDYSDDGVEISGGQQQKIAIARALAKPCSLLILDEPTSALDPLAEAEIYQNFNSLAQGKTAIYISHRMSSSVFCDKILVLDHGKVTDFDSHKNLMKKTDSLYYKLFTLQAENYRIKKELNSL